MTKRIKIGILGLAKIAEKAILPAIIESSNRYKLAGIASKKKDNRSRIEELYKANYFSNYEDLIESNSIDLVYIPLPNSMHYQYAKLALERGIHVICEKSLGCNFNEVEALTKLARRNKILLFENFQFQFHPQLKLIKNLIDNDEIGELRCLRASFGFPPFLDENNIRYNKSLGGGALLDAGAYTTKVSQLILGQGLDVLASSLHYVDNHEVDIWGGAYLKCNIKNTFAEVAFGFDNYYQCGIEIWGSKGKLATNRLFTAPPNYSPQIILENKKGSNILNSEASNHFINMLEYVANFIEDKKYSDKENLLNLDQARLLSDIKKFIK